MASPRSINIRKEAAIERSRNAIRAIWGDEFDLPRRHRDVLMLGAIQLEALADYLECKATEKGVNVSSQWTEPYTGGVAVTSIATSTDFAGDVLVLDASGVVSEGEPLAVEENEPELVAMPEPPKAAPHGRGKRK